jgi:hypothetical protein
MASVKCTHNCGGVFPKLKIVVLFLKYTEIAMASIQLTQQLNWRKRNTQYDKKSQMAWHQRHDILTLVNQILDIMSSCPNKASAKGQ